MDNVQRFTDRIFEHLKTAGIKNGDRNETAVFSRVDIINDAEGALHAEGWYDTAQGERKAYGDWPAVWQREQGSRERRHQGLQPPRRRRLVGDFGLCL
ncbi:hypothetical protein [Limnohabitans sp.]|jgi:hypothetical protein|uniref:hypothetical protein n=1 Tax=Limnohabitans sp. TaxID=1907725 RepID=UPI0037C1AAFF